MADYAPPPGPPPPTVPEGWKAVWNDQYKEWFYVNTFSKASQWDKPTQPAVGPKPDGAPPGAPPGYDHNAAQATGPEKGAYGASPGNMTEDEKLARKLQEEENARSGHPGGSTDRGASDSYYGQGQQGSTPYGQQGSPTYGQQAYGEQQTYGQSSPAPYGQQSLPPRDEKSKGLFGKLAGKFGGGSSSSRPPQQYGQHYPQQGYPPQQYGRYPPQQGGYYPPQQQQVPQKSGGIGAGGALLGAGAGLVGGALLMDAFEDHDQNEYDQGYQAGADNGGGDGGGGDYGGGDGGGDYGGGDDGGGGDF